MSTYSYSSAIPAAGNDPADDQPIMQTNFASISGIISTDHTGFNVSGGGQHEQVTFNSNNVPTIPTSPPVLFTNLVNSLPQLFFYSGNTAQTSNQYVASSSGSTMLLGGIILKWGTGTAPNTISFTSAFPNNCFSVVTTINDASGTPNSAMYVFNITTTGFSTRGTQRTTISSSTPQFWYIAVGN